MKDLKLTIDLLPKGAWGRDLSKTLPQKDWDKLREFCYKKANYHCEICGNSEEQLHAHEVWYFDIPKKTQTLTGIVALCSACHGVKHFRNSTRIGYGQHAKTHFIKINKCDEMTFVGHCYEAEVEFEERNKRLRWKMIVDLDKFGGKGIKFVERSIPFISDPYENIDWSDVDHAIKQNQIAERNAQIPYFIPPKICSIAVDNYEGMIFVSAEHTNKIEWLSGDNTVKTKYNVAGKFFTEFSVEDMPNNSIRFCLTGDGGKAYSQEFKLINISA